MISLGPSGSIPGPYPAPAYYVERGAEGQGGSGPTDLDSRPTALYRMFDADQRLLYVGISVHPLRRFTEHGDDKPWWVDVRHIDLEMHAGRRAALQAEIIAILLERPQHNVAGRDRQMPPPDVCPAGDGYGWPLRWRDMYDGYADTAYRCATCSQEWICGWWSDDDPVTPEAYQAFMAAMTP